MVASCATTRRAHRRGVRAGEQRVPGSRTLSAERPEWTYRRYESDDVVEFVSIDARFPLAAFYSRTSVPTVPPDPFGVAGTASVPATETEGL